MAPNICIVQQKQTIFNYGEDGSSHTRCKNSISTNHLLVEHRNKDVNDKDEKESRHIHYDKQRNAAERSNSRIGITKGSIRKDHNALMDSKLVRTSQVNKLEEEFTYFEVEKRLICYIAKSNYNCEDINEMDRKCELLRMFKFVYGLLKKNWVKKSSRTDNEAWKLLIKHVKVPKVSPSMGSVLGVEIQDEFDCRRELMILGLHCQLIYGIDYMTRPDGKILATSIVATNGYPDIKLSSDVLIYKGEGGKYAKNQEMEGGNLALMNSITEGNCVRVIRGVKAKERKNMNTFVYDGLYKVVGWQEIMPYGGRIFLFELRRCAGQKPIVWEQYK